MVFIYSLIIVVIVVIIGVVWFEKFDSVINMVKMWIINNLGWYYFILIIVIVFFCVFLIFSLIGKFKLGKFNDKLEFNIIFWFVMLFSVGMGIGLVFYGVVEFMVYFVVLLIVDFEMIKVYIEFLRFIFFYWGFYVWVIYGVVVLVFVYF